MKEDFRLTTGQEQLIVSKAQQIFAAVVKDESIADMDVTLVGVQLRELCHPLTDADLREIRRPEQAVRVDAAHCSGESDPETGLLAFRVGYGFTGNDGADVHREALLGLTCSILEGSDGRETIAIHDVVPFHCKADGTYKRPGKLARGVSLRKRERRRSGKGDAAGWILLDILGGVLEIVLDMIFDG